MRRFLSCLAAVFLPVVLVLIAGCGSRAMYRDQLDYLERSRLADQQGREAAQQRVASAATECAKKLDAGSISACMLGVTATTQAQLMGTGGQPQAVPLPAPPPSAWDRVLAFGAAVAPALVQGAVAWHQSDANVEITQSNNATQAALYNGAFGAAGQAVGAVRDVAASSAQASAAASAATAAAMADVSTAAVNANGSVSTAAVQANGAAVTAIAATLPELAPRVTTTTNVGRDQVSVTGNNNETSTGVRAGTSVAQVTGNENETRQDSSGPNPGGPIVCTPGSAGNGGTGGTGGNAGGTTGPGGLGGTGGLGGSTGGTNCGSSTGGG